MNFLLNKQYLTKQTKDKKELLLQEYDKVSVSPLFYYCGQSHAIVRTRTHINRKLYFNICGNVKEDDENIFETATRIFCEDINGHFVNPKLFSQYIENNSLVTKTINSIDGKTEFTFYIVCDFVGSLFGIETLQHYNEVNFNGIRSTLTLLSRGDFQYDAIPLKDLYEKFNKKFVESKYDPNFKIKTTNLKSSILNKPNRISEILVEHTPLDVNLSGSVCLKFFQLFFVGYNTQLPFFPKLKVSRLNSLSFNHSNKKSQIKKNHKQKRRRKKNHPKKKKKQ